MAPLRLSDEELIKLASIGQSDRQPNEAELFVAAIGITEGQTRVSYKYVYLAYSKWTQEPLDRRTFCKQFSSLFKKHKNTDIYFLLDPTPFNLGKETETEVAEQLMKEAESCQRRKKRKQRDQKPSTQA